MRFPRGGLALSSSATIPPGCRKMGRESMNEDEVRRRAFAMPLTSPAFPPGPYRFVDREFLIITYKTDPDKLRAVVPAPLEVDLDNPVVKYEFIRMPDSTGFGD